MKTLAQESTQPLLTQGRTVTIVRINFDAGQSCQFAFRADTPSETLFVTVQGVRRRRTPRQAMVVKS